MSSLVSKSNATEAVSSDSVRLVDMFRIYLGSP